MNKQLQVIAPEVQDVTIPALYDLDLLRKRCTMDEDEFRPLGTTVVNGKPEDFYIYIDRGSDILGVAHLDFVATNIGFVSVEWEKNGERQVVVWNGALDDRLGVFLLLDVLPKMGLNFDVLLTTGEEWGRSTAKYFEPTKDYNWIFEFDRTGIDVVMYQYDTDELQDMLTSVGLHPGMGSFSDIVSLEHLGVSGFNFGTGYYAEHSDNHHAVLSDTESMCWLFREFYNKYKDTKMVYVPKQDDYWDMKYYDWYDSEYDSYYSDRRLGSDILVDQEDIDMNIYDSVFDALIDEGVDADEAEELAWEEAMIAYERDNHKSTRDIGVICITCHALVRYEDLWEGKCMYCRTVLPDRRGLHRYTDAEWIELEGGG